MLVFCRGLLLGLTVGLLAVPTGWAGDRDSLPQGLANLHNQTAQRQARRAQTHRDAQRHGPGRYHRYGVTPWAQPGGCGWPTFGYGIVTPGFGYGVVTPGFGQGIFGPSIFQFQLGANYFDNWLPPIHAPASLHFGPLANERFFGIQRPPLMQQPNPWDQNHQLHRNLMAQEIAEKLRQSNPAARQRAERFVQFGDNLFRQQRFHEAVQRYKSAIEAAPDAAEAYYRNAYGLIAVKQYALALKAFQIALQLEPALAQGDFRLQELYGENGLARTAHLESLARAAHEQPDDGGLLFLVGAFLHDDGQPQRAQPFFEKAVVTNPELHALSQAFVEGHPDGNDDPQVLVGREHEI